MTVDDDNSVYVGGLPLATTEETLRKHFGMYGHIVAAKVVNERGYGGRCYGFVTFRNPRAAFDAIDDMNGRKIDGQVIRVNEVMTRGGGANFKRGTARYSTGRGSVWDRDINQERTSYNDKEMYLARVDYHSRERERSLDRDQARKKGHEHMHDCDYGRERGHEHTHNNDHTRNHFLDKERERNREGFDKEHKKDHDQNSERGQDAESGRDMGTKRNDDHGKISDECKDQQANKQSGFSFSASEGRGYASPSTGNNAEQGQVDKQLESAINRREDLQNEISHWEIKIKDQQQRVSDLQKKSQKLEDTLTTARKLHQQRQMQLMELHKCFMQVKDFTRRLESLERESQELFDSAMMDINFNGGGVVANGST